MTEITQLLNFFAAPFVMCLILAGIHCYLGLHVLARGVIFVDLSLAQIAGLGASLAILLGFEHHSYESYFVSLGCTFAAAALFALARRQEKRFSQEAVIGIVYAFGSAAVILVVDKMAHGSEHIKELLVGQVLWVTWPDVIKTGLIYSVVGLAHFVFRRPLLAASFDSTSSKSAFWDFIFYAIFGVVITSSVSVAGVLQVFAYLIVPAVVGTLFFTSLKAKLIFGWVLGFLLSFLGLSLSHILDLPAGALIVVCFSAVPLLLLIFSPLIKFKKF